MTMTTVTVTITVTADHIRCGLARECYICPVALAISPHLKPRHFVSVTETRIVIFDADAAQPSRRVFETNLPRAARDFVWAFDFQGPDAVAPFSFPLELPADVLKEATP